MMSLAVGNVKFSLLLVEQLDGVTVAWPLFSS